MDEDFEQKGVKEVTKSQPLCLEQFKKYWSDARVVFLRSVPRFGVSMARQETQSFQ